MVLKRFNLRSFKLRTRLIQGVTMVSVQKTTKYTNKTALLVTFSLVPQQFSYILHFFFVNYVSNGILSTTFQNRA